MGRKQNTTKREVVICSVFFKKETDSGGSKYCGMRREGRHPRRTDQERAPGQWFRRHYMDVPGNSSCSCRIAIKEENTIIWLRCCFNRESDKTLRQEKAKNEVKKKIKSDPISPLVSYRTVPTTLQYVTSYLLLETAGRNYISRNILAYYYYYIVCNYVCVVVPLRIRISTWDLQCRL